MKSFSKRLPAAIFSVCSMGGVTNAHAQGFGAQLEEVIVTAEKRAVNIQDAPAAITAFSGDELVSLGVNNIAQMSQLFPSARFENTGYATHLYVRGIGAEQDRVAVDQLVNMTIDGVNLPRELAAVGLFDLNDIELLPGPQGTLYGASSVGGVIVVSANRPNHTNDNKLSMELGNYGLFHVTDAQNFDISNTLAARAAVNFRRHGPYQSSGAATANALTVRLGLQFDPSENFSAYVWGLIVTDDGKPADTGVLNPQGGFFPAGGSPWDIVNACITQACNSFSNLQSTEPNFGSHRDYIVAGQFDWRVGDVTISDIPSVLDSRMEIRYNRWITRSQYKVRNQQVTNELRASNDAGATLQWLAGLYLYQNKANQLFTTSNYELPDFTLNSYAPYGQIIYSVSDKLRVVTGLRYSSTKKKGNFLRPNVLGYSEGSWSNTDWKAGIEYDLNPNTMAYLTLQTGTSPGTLDAQNPTPLVAVNPLTRKAALTGLTKLNSVTAGWKSRLLDNRLQFNNEMFYYDYKDFLIQTIVCATSSCLSVTNAFFNAPKIVIWGDQLDVKWRMTEADQVSLAAAYTHGRTGNWVTAPGAQLSKQELFHLPELTTSLGYQHAFSMDNGASTIFRVDSSWSSSYWGDFQTNVGGPVHKSWEKQDAFTKTGVSVTYHAPEETWTVGLWALNLENKGQLGPGGANNYPQPFGQAGYAVGGVAAIAGEPRTYGMRFTANFE